MLSPAHPMKVCAGVGILALNVILETGSAGPGGDELINDIVGVSLASFSGASRRPSPKLCTTQTPREPLGLAKPYVALQASLHVA